jgi:hypothetical protein
MEARLQLTLGGRKLHHAHKQLILHYTSYFEFPNYYYKHEPGHLLAQWPSVDDIATTFQPWNQCP